MLARFWYCVLALCLVTPGLSATGLSANDVTCGPSETYRAGIVEFKPPPQAETDEETILNNAKQFHGYAARAAELGVEVLVFPEYGLVGLDDLGNRTSMAGYLQDVPDPKLHHWNPCTEPDKFSRSEVLHELSCAARQNSLFIVANLLSKESCHPPLETATSSHKCPADGQYQFNTNVVFAPNGTLLARYRKRNLFMEEAFADRAPEPEYVILDLGFVRIATIICFDLLWARPTVELVEKHGVRNIAYPTAWVNELPFMTAPQAFSSIAYGLGINLLAANFFKPAVGAMGSGIYSSTRGLLNGTWDISTPGRMVIADVPVEPSPVPSNDQSLTCEVPTDPHATNNLELVIPDTHPFVEAHIPSSKPVGTHKILYETLKNYAHANLTDVQGSITQLCQGTLCCNLTYVFSNRDGVDNYKFVVSSGVRKIPGGYNLGLQICAVLRCESEDDASTCGRIPDSSHTPSNLFHRLAITGRFDTKYLSPRVYSTKLELVTTDKWTFSKRGCSQDNGVGMNVVTIGKLNITSDVQSPILEAGILARVYEWDR